MAIIKMYRQLIHNRDGDLSTCGIPPRSLAEKLYSVCEGVGIYT